MNLITKEEIKMLAADHEQPCVSIFMPTYRAGAETQQNSVRFKNLIREAEDRLEESGMRKPQIASLMKSARELENDGIFWQHQSDGLAVFFSPDLFQAYSLPLNFDELVIVGDHFHIKPLLQLFSKNGRFFILALSQNDIRLLEGTRYQVDEVDVDDLPPSLAEALRWDDVPERSEYHFGERGRGGNAGRPSEHMFQGHGVDDDDAKNRILRYFHKIDKALQEVLAQTQDPLILAGVEYLFPIYRQANTYNGLHEDGITGNPEELSEKILHEKALELLTPHFEKEQEQAAALYQEQAGMETGRASNSLEEILVAAFAGRVGQIFIPTNTERWGIYDWSTGEIEYQDESTAENVDLLDLVAVQTFLNDGVVYLVNPAEIPDDVTIAAVFRY